MAALWRCGRLSFAALIDEVRKDQAWGDATIKTLLHRLIRKNAIRSERDDGRQVYRALVDRDAYLAAEVQALIDRLFGGDRAQLAGFLSIPR